MPTDELTVPEHEPGPAEKRTLRLIDPAPAGAETVVFLYQLPPGSDVRGTGCAKLGDVPSDT